MQLKFICAKGKLNNGPRKLQVIPISMVEIVKKFYRNGLNIFGNPDDIEFERMAM